MEDIRQVFNCHKDLFYATYARWVEAKKAYLVDFLSAEYLVGKTGVRDALLGHEPPLEVPPLPRREKPPVPVRVAMSGPWGAVKRR